MFLKLSLKYIDMSYSKFLLTDAKCLTNSVGWGKKQQTYKIFIKSVLIWHILYFPFLNQKQLTDITLKSFPQPLQRLLPTVSTERPIKNPRSLIQDLGSIYSLSKGTISTLSKGKDLFGVPHWITLAKIFNPLKRHVAMKHLFCCSHKACLDFRKFQKPQRKTFPFK